MKSVIIHIIALVTITLIPQAGFTQTVIKPQPTTNLFDGNATTNWVSSFNGETFPIDLEIQFGATETFCELMMRQVTTSATDLAGCKIDSFIVFVKSTANENYPATPAYTGRMNTASTNAQWFTLDQTYSATHLLIRIYSLSEAESTNAALSELGIKAQKKNGNIASSIYNKNMPNTWAGITWTNTEPFQITAINWSEKTLMSGNFTTSTYPLLQNNYNFTGTNISVVTGLFEPNTDNSIEITPTFADHIISVTSSSRIKNVMAVSMNGLVINLQESNGSVFISNLKAGQYILAIVTENGCYYKKIFKI